jgi:hypothetical protein
VTDQRSDAPAAADHSRRSRSPRERGAGQRAGVRYPIPFDRLAPEVQEIARTKNVGLAQTGEPRITTYDPRDVARALGERGFALIEDVGPAELDGRYCAGRTDGLRGNPENRVAHARAV